MTKYSMNTDSVRSVGHDLDRLANTIMSLGHELARAGNVAPPPSDLTVIDFRARITRSHIDGISRNLHNEARSAASMANLVDQLDAWGRRGPLGHLVGGAFLAILGIGYKQWPQFTTAPPPKPPAVTAAPAAPAAIPNAGPSGTQNFSAERAVEIALAENGTSRAIGDSQPGECVMSVQRWINSAGGHFGGGSTVSSYTNSGAVQVGLTQVRAGDVIQYTSTTNPDSYWPVGVHTVMVAGVNADGSFKIVQSNVPYRSGKVSVVESWRPKPPAGFEARVWRFAKN